MTSKEKTKKSNRFFSLFRTKKSKDATKEMSKSISVEESFTEINDLIPTTRVEFRSISKEEEVSTPLETQANIANLENTAPALPKTNGVAKKQSVKRENSQKVKVLAVKSGVSRTASRASKRKRKARAAPPPPTTQPQNTVETIEKVDELVPPKPPRDPKFVEEPTPSRKNTTVEEKKEEIRRQLSQDHLSSIGDPDEVMSLKSQSSTSCSSRRIETEVLHYSPAGSLRGAPAPRKEQSMSTEDIIVVERRSNIILNDSQRVRSIPISMYDGRPKERVAPTPPDTRKTAPAPPPPPVFTLPPAMINGFVANSRPMAPAIPTHGVKANGKEDPTKKMTEQDQDLWVRYEELKNKFERWKALQMEDKSSAEAKKLQKELIHDNDRVVEMLRESYPDHVGISTMRGTFITTKKKRQSLNTDMFKPRLPSSPTIRAPLIITPTYTSSYASSPQVPSTSSPTTSRSATPKTTSSASISPSASDDSVDSGMGRNSSNKKVYSIPVQVQVVPTVAPVTLRPQLKKQAASMDENSNYRMKNGGIRSSQENQKAVDRIHEEARELIRKEKELRGTGPTTPTVATKEVTPIEFKIKPKENATKPTCRTADAHVIKSTVSPQTRHRQPQVAPPPPPVQKIPQTASAVTNVRSIRTEAGKTSSPSLTRATDSVNRSTPENHKSAEYRDPKLTREKVLETKVNTIYRNPDSMGPYRIPSINNVAPAPVSSPKTSNVPRLTDNEYAKTPMNKQIKKEVVYSREAINGAPKINGTDNGAPKTNGVNSGAPKPYGVNGFNNGALNNNKPTQPIYAVSKVQPTINRKQEEKELTVGGISHTRHSSDTVLSQPKRPTNLMTYQTSPVKDSTAKASSSPVSSQTIQKIIRDRDSTSARNTPQVETPAALPSPANIRKVVQEAKVTPPSTPRLPVMSSPFNEPKRETRTATANVREVNTAREEQSRNIQKTVTAASRPPATQSSPLTRPVALDINLALANGIPTLRKVAPPVERHGITTGKVVDSASTSYDSPIWTPSVSTIPAPPPPPPPLMNKSPVRPAGGAPMAPPPPPPQLKTSSPLQVSMQQLTAQKDRLKPATPTERPAGPIDDRDALMAAIRNAGGLNGLRKTART